jgi:hypothetical protein
MRSAIVRHFVGAERAIDQVTMADHFEVAFAVRPGKPGDGISRRPAPGAKSVEWPQFRSGTVRSFVGFGNIVVPAIAVIATALATKKRVRPPIAARIVR